MRAGDGGARAYNTIANRKTYSFESRPAALGRNDAPRQPTISPRHVRHSLAALTMGILTEVCAGPMSVYLRCVYLLNSDGRVTVLLSPRKLKSSGFLAEARESLIEI